MQFVRRIRWRGITDFATVSPKLPEAYVTTFGKGLSGHEPGPLVQFFTYALASLEEVADYLVECRTRKFIDEACYVRLHDLSEHTRATTINFMRAHQSKLREAKRSSSSRRMDRTSKARRRT